MGSATRTTLVSSTVTASLPSPGCRGLSRRQTRTRLGAEFFALPFFVRSGPGRASALVIGSVTSAAMAVAATGAVEVVAIESASARDEGSWDVGGGCQGPQGVFYCTQQNCGGYPTAGYPTLGLQDLGSQAARPLRLHAGSGLSTCRRAARSLPLATLRAERGRWSVWGRGRE